MNQAIHRRIREWRQRRGLTQAQFAAAFDPPRSEVWVRKLEAGDRQADPRITVLEQIAQILQIPLVRLLADEPQPPTAQHASDYSDQTATLRAVLLAPRPAQGPPSDPHRVLRDAAWGFDAFQSGHYAGLLRALPDMVTAARGLPDTPSGTHAGYRVHHLAATVLMKYGGGAAAWHAAERALDLARASGDPVATALAAQVVVYTMVSIGEAPTAAHTAAVCGDELDAALTALGVDGHTALGMLWLKAAVAAADAGDAQQAHAALGRAGELADRVPLGANRWKTGFDALNVQLHAISIERQLLRYGTAARQAETIPDRALADLPRERRAHHRIECAQTLATLHRDDDALTTLLKAEADSPQEVHNRPAARALIQQLLSRHPVNPAALRELAARTALR